MLTEFRYVTTNLWQQGSTNNPIIAELPFTHVNYTQQLNSVGTFQGEVLLSGINSKNLNVFDGTTPGKTILWVLYSDPKTYTTRAAWSGVIWHREYDSESQTLQIAAQEMMSLYQKRRISVDTSFASQNPCLTAKSLMQYAESKTVGTSPAINHSNTGLTYATVPSVTAIDPIKYNGYQYKSVYQAIKDLAQNYFDFAIRPYNSGGTLSNQFEMGAPLGTIYSSTSATATVLQFPGNIISYRFPEDATSAANTLYGLGYGANNNKLGATAISDLISSSDWPLLEDSANYIDISTQTVLNKVTYGQMQATAYPPTTVEVIIAPYVDPYYEPVTSYRIGDEVRLDIIDDFFPNGISLVLRIVGISVNPGEDGPSRVTLTLTRQLTAGSVS